MYMLAPYHGVIICPGSVGTPTDIAAVFIQGWNLFDSSRILVWCLFGTCNVLKLIFSRLRGNPICMP